MSNYLSSNRGFSLIALNLLMVVLVTILACALYILKPARKYASEFNTKRKNDIILIANAVSVYLSTHPENVLQNLATMKQEIASTGVDICMLLIPDYITTLPADPSRNSTDITKPCPPGYRTGYYISLNSDNTITISAPNTAMPPEKEMISVTRKIYKPK